MKLGFKMVCSGFYALFAGAAFATPVYTGDTDGSDFGLNPSVDDVGYYIWSDSPTEWSIRWTGDEGGYNWFGSITVLPGDLDCVTEDECVTEVRFERNDSSWNSDDDWPSYIPSSFDFISWSAYAGPGWDGIDFRLHGESRVIGFSLGSTYFDQLFTDPETGAKFECDECDSSKIFISDGYHQPQVLIDYNAHDGHTYQQFEIKVPEPGTLALLGLGLLGIGASRRKAAS